MSMEAITNGLSGKIAFLVLLFVCMVTNGALLVASTKCAHKGSLSSINSLLLGSLAVSSLAWLLPCFFQCLAELASDKQDTIWSVGTSFGCDLMATYAVFASASSLLLVTELAYVTWRRQTGRTEATYVRSFVGFSFLVSAVLAALPSLGVGKFSNTNVGFCYLDFSSIESVLPLELLIVPCVLATTFFYSATAVQPKLASDNMKWWHWLIFAAFSLTSWAMWVPAAFIGLSAGPDVSYPDMFPGKYLIVAGALAHFQFFMNPILYGLYWRNWAASLSPYSKVQGIQQIIDARVSIELA